MAVYGGGGNTFSNLYIADSLTYPGVTIGSLAFGGIPAMGFESTPQTNFSNISLVRDGGHFWGGQTFPALWIFSAEFKLQGIRISDVDITDPTYSGMMFQTKWNGSTSLNPIADTIITDLSVTGAQKSGDDFDAKSGFGLWANPAPESGPGTGGRLRDDQRAAREQQRRGHREHHDHVHHQRHLTRREGAGRLPKGR